MDGKTARLFTEKLVRAITSADIVKRKLTFDFLNAGAEEFVSKTGCIIKTQSITTVASQADYDLAADYLRMYLKTDDPRGGELFVKYVDSSSVEHMITFKPYQKVIYDNDTTDVTLPDSFTIHAKTSLPAQLTGATTSAGAVSGGQATLTDTGESFETYVSERDIVHNSSKDATGVVLTVTDDENLVTAMFTSNGNPTAWLSGATWIIQPVARMQLQLVAPPESASETVTVYYVAKPNPVYSDYGTWLVNDVYHKAFCFYAAWLYLTQYEIKKIEGAAGIHLSLGAKYLATFNDIVHTARHDIDLSLGKTGYSMKNKA